METPAVRPQTAPGYAPALDGVRAVAVLLILPRHLQPILVPMLGTVVVVLVLQIGTVLLSVPLGLLMFYLVEQPCQRLKERLT